MSDAASRAETQEGREAPEASPAQAGAVDAGVSRLLMDCPFCTSDDVERVGADWVCRCCSKAWKAFTKADVGLLRLFGIASA